MVKSYRSIFLALLVAGISPGVYAQKATVTIQASGPGKPISPDLVGIFFEDLNCAADGGLYAELVQNRSFEYSPTEQPSWNPLCCWELQKRGDGDGSITVAEMRPIHENNPHYTLLTVLTGPDADAVNKDGEPPVIRPESSTVPVTPALAYTVPACSLTVFRINR